MSFQAGVSVGSPVGERGQGHRALRRGHQGGLLGGHVGAELVVEDVGTDHELVATGADGVRVEGAGQGAPGELGRQVERRLTVVGRERVDVDQADDGVVAGGGLGHDHPAVGVGDEQDRCADRGDDVTHVGGVTGEVAQRVGDGDDTAVVAVVAGDDDGAVAVEAIDHRVPAGRLGEGTVDEDDRGLVL